MFTSFMKYFFVRQKAEVLKHQFFFDNKKERKMRESKKINYCDEKFETEEENKNILYIP